MALIFDTIIAGDPPTGGDTGEQFATKINSNFTKLQNADVATGIALGSGNQTAYGVTNVDAALAMLPNAKWFGKYSKATATGTFTNSYVSFSTEEKDDLNIFDLTTYPTRITIPTGAKSARITIEYMITNIVSNQTAIFTISKNGVDMHSIFNAYYMYTDLSCKYTYQKILDVTPGDYFQLFINVSGTIGAVATTVEILQ